VARPRRETGRFQEEMVDVVMNARARTGPPMTMFRLCGLVRWVPTWEENGFQWRVEMGKVSSNQMNCVELID
jgi:hypothetical protein